MEGEEGEEEAWMSEEDNEEEEEEEEEGREEKEREKEKEARTEEEEEELVAYMQMKTRRPLGKAVLNEEGLQQATVELQQQWGGGKWLDRLDYSARHELTVEDAHDDLSREMSFYDMALEGVREVHRRFREQGISYHRPGDFFAQMAKSDDHMARIRAQLFHEKKQIGASLERRKEREMKKYAKQVQVEKVQERAQRKRENLSAITKWRKDRKAGRAGEEELDQALHGTTIGTKRKATESSSRPVKGAKRASRDAKYGFGGKKRGTKHNTGQSAADVTEFSLNKNRAPMKGFRGGRRQGGGGGRGGGRGGGGGREGRGGGRGGRGRGGRGGGGGRGRGRRNKAK